MYLRTVINSIVFLFYFYYIFIYWQLPIWTVDWRQRENRSDAPRCQICKYLTINLCAYKSWQKCFKNFGIRTIRKFDKSPILQKVFLWSTFCQSTYSKDLFWPLRTTTLWSMRTLKCNSSRFISVSINLIINCPFLLLKHLAVITIKCPALK